MNKVVPGLAISALALVISLLAATSSATAVAARDANASLEAIGPLETTASLAAPAAQQALRRESERAFGFRAGEVRRYVLADDPLAPGVRSEWTIRLNRVLGEEPNRTAAFWLEYRREERPSAGVDDRSARAASDQGEVGVDTASALVAWEHGEVVVNDSGFPLRFWFTQHDVQSLTSINYVYEDGVYGKTVQDAYRQSRTRVPIAAAPGWPDAAAFEMYLDLPTRSGFCLSPLREQAGTVGWAESLFGNPGLLTLMLPQSLPERRSEWGVVMLELAGLTDTLRVRRIDLGEETRVQLGDRRVGARRLEVEGLSDEVYVDDKGVVLRAGPVFLLDPGSSPEPVAEPPSAASTGAPSPSEPSNLVPAVVSAGTAPPSGAIASQRLFTDASQTMFGFSIGEVRRYALGPEEELNDDDAARWTMRLTRIVGEEPDRRAVFWMEYRRYRGPAIPFLGNQRMAAWDQAELIVNEFGFPETLWIAQHSEEFFSTTLYSYRDGGYRVVVRTSDRQWQTENDLRLRNSTLDLARRSGLHVYGAGSASNASNPGLLSLMLPHPLPAGTMGWETSLISFLVPPSRSVPWYFNRTGLRLESELTEIRLGDRTIPARRLEFDRRAGNAYVDERGVVLRVDLNTPLFGLGGRWIRLLDR